MEEVIELTAVDIQNVIEIIDVCTKRGSFEGKELAVVGGVRNKFEAFLTQAIENSNAEAQNQEVLLEAPEEE